MTGTAEVGGVGLGEGVGGPWGCTPRERAKWARMGQPGWVYLYVRQSIALGWLRFICEGRARGIDDGVVGGPKLII